MLLPRLPAILGYLFVPILIAGCSGGNSTGAAGVTVVNEQPPAVPQMQTGGGTVQFPEMQGRWAKGCLLFDDEEPSNGYERSVVTVTGNDFVVDTKIYSDSNCVTPLALGFLQLGDDFQSYATLRRPEGSANTSVGEVPFINIEFTRFTIDNEPLVPAAVALNAPYVDYTVVYVDRTQMYLGDSELSGQLGDTSQTRSVTLDFADPLTRQ